MGLMVPSCLALLLVFCKQSLLSSAASPPACASNADCLAGVGEGSECLLKKAGTTTSSGTIAADGACSHPFPSGCLYSRLPGWKKKRVCNSDDPPGAANAGLCRESSVLDYMEIRLYSEGWESVYFENWILQILLSEMLDVPTTIELGRPDARIGLYDPDLSDDSGSTGDFTFYGRATDIGDCRKASRDAANYESCAHFNPELWNINNRWVLDLVNRSKLEPPQGLGILGREGLHILKFTALKDPSLTSYLGFAGEENRRKLAETFKRPTTWKDYCEQVSLDNCTTPDSVALRGPPVNDPVEENRYFVEGAYSGHFRMTEENDCDLNPTTCTGHVVDYPCEWLSPVTQQVYHLGIAMSGNGDESGGGYKLSAMTEILQAANATRSDIFIMWWEPQAFYRSFIGTDSEMIRVTFPPTTKECENARFHAGCAPNISTAARAGNATGACDRAAQPLGKGIAYGLYEHTYNAAIPKAKQSPAYEVLNQFKMTNVQLYDIFAYWSAKPSPRSALCDWVVDNFDYLQDLSPRSYPRVLQHEKMDSLMYASTCLGGIALLFVTWTIWTTYSQRMRRAIRAAQVEFLWLLLAGLLTISVGAITLAVPPSNASCVAAMWLINFGYVFELVPLIVKVAAINRLMNAARQMRRVVVRRESLFGSVFMINGLVAVFLVVWTILDPLQKKAEYELTDATTADGETIVKVHNYCASESQVWQFVAVSVNAVLLLCATVLAFQTRNLRQDFNESQTLAMMIYSHFVFLVLRLITFFLSGFVSGAILAHCQSLMFSIDIIVTILIYFVPKFVAKEAFLSGCESESLGTCSISGFRAGGHGHRGQLRTNFIRIGGVVHRIIAQLSAVSTAEAIGSSEHEKVAEQPHPTARIKEASQEQQAAISEDDELESDAENRSFCPGQTPSSHALQPITTPAPSCDAMSRRGTHDRSSIEILFTSAVTNGASEFENVIDGLSTMKTSSFEDPCDDHTHRKEVEEADDADTRTDNDVNSLASRNRSDVASDKDDQADQQESGLPEHGLVQPNQGCEESPEPDKEAGQTGQVHEFVHYA